MSRFPRCRTGTERFDSAGWLLAPFCFLFLFFPVTHPSLPFSFGYTNVSLAFADGPYVFPFLFCFFCFCCCLRHCGPAHAQHVAGKGRAACIPSEMIGRRVKNTPTHSNTLNSLTHTRVCFHQMQYYSSFQQSYTSRGGCLVGGSKQFS